MAGTEGSGNDGTPDWSREVAAPEPIEFDFTGVVATPESVATGSPPPNRRWRSAVGAAVALVAIGGGIVAVGGSDDAGSADDPATTISRPPTSLSALPTVPTTRDEDETVGEIDFDGQLEQFPIDAPEYSALRRGWRSGSIEVPAGLAAIEPTTVVVLTADGVLREVDFPSGITRDFTVGVATDFVDPMVAVGRSAALVAVSRGRANPAGQSFSLLRAGADPVDVLVPLQSSRVRERPGTDEFVGLGVNLAVSSVARLTVAGDGLVSTQPITFGPELSRDGLRFGPSGTTIVSDGGAVFERSEGDGTTLVADGELIAASSHHVLTRSCTEEYVCNGILLDAATGERSEVRLDPTFVPSLADDSAQVSPDGRWLRYRTTPFRQLDRVLDLNTGVVTELPPLTEPSAMPRNDVWAADSSGFFRLDGTTLEFLDVETGVGSALDMLGPVVDFGVRLDLTGTPEPPVISNTGFDLELVAVDESGSFHDLDLETGRVVSYPADRPRRRFGRTIVITDANVASAVANDRGASARLDRTSGSVESSDDPYDAVAHRGPLMDTLWAPVLGDGPNDGRVDVVVAYRLTGVDGRQLSTEIALPDGFSIVGGDVTGGLLAIGESGDVTLLRADSAELLTSTGQLLGLGSSTMIVRECPPDEECRDVGVDRATGERTPTKAPAIATAQVATVSGTGAIVENTVSPDGNVLIGPTTEGPLEWVATDLATGAVVEIGTARTGSRIAWTADSMYAVYHSRDFLYVYDRAAGRVNRLVDAPRIVGFTVR